MRYNLYWVKTPCNYENWFAIAESEKQAEIFHEYAEGFNSDYAKAKFLCNIQDSLIEKHQVTESGWPSHELLIDLGGKFMASDNPRKINFNGIVYSEGIFTEKIFFDEIGEKAGVYVIRIQNTNKYKIGITKNLKRRIKQFSTGNPENIKIDYFIATERYKTLETELHEKFKTHRISGEWFEFDEVELFKLESELAIMIEKSPDEYDFYNVKLISVLARVY